MRCARKTPSERSPRLAKAQLAAPHGGACPAATEVILGRRLRHVTDIDDKADLKGQVAQQMERIPEELATGVLGRINYALTLIVQPTPSIVSH